MKLNVLIEYARAILLCSMFRFTLFSFLRFSNGIECSLFDESFTSLIVRSSSLVQVQGGETPFSFLFSFLLYEVYLLERNNVPKFLSRHF